MNSLNKCENENICILYNRYKSIKLVCDELNLGYKYVRARLIKSNIVLNKKGGKKKYTFDENFFSKDTPESFYWAGFIAADGWIWERYKNSKYLIIDLSSKDESHLHKFKEVIKFSGNILSYSIKTSKTKNSKIIINSNKITNDLARFNIVPRKSLTLTFPEWLVNHELVNHFMRGYFDGDGSVFKLGNNLSQIRGSVCGTKEFLDVYENILIKNNTSLSKNKLIKNNMIFVLRFNGNNIVKTIRDFLYKNSNNSIRLSRKYDIIKDL